MAAVDIDSARIAGNLHRTAGRAGINNPGQKDGKKQVFKVYHLISTSMETFQGAIVSPKGQKKVSKTDHDD